MSDMEQSDVVAPAADAAPVAEPVAPDQPAEAPAAPVAAEPAPAEPTAEELQAEIDALKEQVEAQNGADSNPQIDPWPVPVIARVPSSESPTQQPEAAPSVVEAPLSLVDAVRALLIFVKGRRTVGDSDLDAALADVEAALLAQDASA